MRLFKMRLFKSIGLKSTGLLACLLLTLGTAPAQTPVTSGAILFPESWDGTQFAPPALGGEWFANLATVVNTGPHRSGTYACDLNVPSPLPNGAQPVAMVSSSFPDSYGGNVVAWSWFWVPAGNTDSRWSFTRGVFAKPGPPAWGGAGTSAYYATLTPNASGGGTETLRKDVSGTDSQIGTTVTVPNGTLTPVAPATGVWVGVATASNGTTQSAVLKTAGGQYLNSAGAMQATQVAAIAVVDSSLTGAGQYGFGSYHAAGPLDMYEDDFELDVAGTPPAAVFRFGVQGTSIDVAAGTIGQANAPSVAAANYISGRLGGGVVQNVIAARSGAATKDFLPGSDLLAQEERIYASWGGVTWVLDDLSGVNDSNTVQNVTAAVFKANKQANNAELVRLGYKIALCYPTYTVPGSYSGLLAASSNTLQVAYEPQIDSLVDNVTEFLADTNAFTYTQGHTTELSDGVHQIVAGAVNLGTEQGVGLFRAAFTTPIASGSAVAPIAGPANIILLLNAQPTQTFTIPSGTKGLKTGQQFTVSYQGVRYTITVGVVQTVPQSIYNALHGGGYI